MLLYDVILVGFPDGPNIAASPAEAIAQVFRIPIETANAMAASTPTVVRTGVPEEVARKYFNAFAYIGARCEFRLASPVVPAPPGAASDALAEPRPKDGPVHLGNSPPERALEPTGEFPIAVSESPDMDDVLTPDMELPADPTTAPDVSLGLFETGEHASSEQSEGGFTHLGGSAGWSDVGAPPGDNLFEPETGPDFQGPTHPTLARPDGPLAPGDQGRPSVAQVRAAWEAGQDISIGTAAERRERSEFDGWDPWIDSGLPEADFPSGVALQDGAVSLAGPDAADGTRLEAPRHSELLAALDARSDDEVAAGTSRPLDAAPEASGSRSTRTASGSNPFGAPLGVRQAPAAELDEASDPEVPVSPPAAPRTHESVEVPRSLQFVRVPAVESSKPGRGE